MMLAMWRLSLREDIRAISSLLHEEVPGLNFQEQNNWVMRVSF